MFADCLISTAGMTPMMIKGGSALTLKKWVMFEGMGVWNGVLESLSKITP